MRTRVEVHGLRELRRDLKVIDKQLPKKLNVRIKRAAEPVKAEAARLAPNATGRLAGSLRVATRGSRVAIVASKAKAPHASIVHWGGRHPVYGNRNVWVAVPPRPFIEKAVSNKIGELERNIADEVEDAMRDIGFH